MTLSEMASLVCGKVRQSDAASVARCKEYLRQRYLMIAAEELWNDLIARLEFTFNVTETVAGNLFGPNLFGRSAGIWHLPAGVDRVLSVRTSDGGLPVVDRFQMFSTTLDQFAETGEAVQFEAEGAVVADLRGLLDTVEAQGVVLLSDAADAGQVVRIRYMDLDGEVQTLAATLDAGGGYSNTFYPQVIFSASKQATSAAVSIVLDGSTVGAAEASATAWKKFPRLRLFPIPTADTALKALVKLKAQEMTDDGDEPQIRGIENCLMSFAQADMLQRARAYAKAEAVVGEGSALLKQLKTVAVAQEANLNRILPFVGEVPGEMTNMGGKGYW